MYIVNQFSKRRDEYIRVSLPQASKEQFTQKDY